MTSMLMTKKKTEEEFEQVSCISYPVTLKDQIGAILDLNSEVNIINPVFTFQ